MTGVLNEMRSTNRLITKESVFHYCETKSRSASITHTGGECTYNVHNCMYMYVLHVHSTCVCTWTYSVFGQTW